MLYNNIQIDSFFLFFIINYQFEKDLKKKLEILRCRYVAGCGRNWSSLYRDAIFDGFAFLKVHSRNAAEESRSQRALLHCNILLHYGTIEFLLGKRSHGIWNKYNTHARRRVHQRVGIDTKATRLRTYRKEPSCVCWCCLEWRTGDAPAAIIFLLLYLHYMCVLCVAGYIFYCVYAQHNMVATVLSSSSAAETSVAGEALASSTHATASAN